MLCLEGEFNEIDTEIKLKHGKCYNDYIWLLLWEHTGVMQQIFFNFETIYSCCFLFLLYYGEIFLLKQWSAFYKELTPSLILSYSMLFQHRCLDILEPVHFINEWDSLIWPSISKKCHYYLKLGLLMRSYDVVKSQSHGLQHARLLCLSLFPQIPVHWVSTT